jgi:hypothetical protein
LATTQDINRIRESNGKPPLTKIGYYCDSPHCNGTTTGTVLLINAIANYYKHHDEWGDNWPNNPTTNALANVGINSTTDFPCYQAAVILFGDDRVWQFARLRQMIAVWRQHILSAYA